MKTQPVSSLMIKADLESTGEQMRNDPVRTSKRIVKVKKKKKKVPAQSRELDFQ